MPGGQTSRLNRRCRCFCNSGRRHVRGPCCPGASSCSSHRPPDSPLAHQTSASSRRWLHLVKGPQGATCHTGGVEETADGRSIAFSRRELIRGAGVLLGAGVVGAGVSSCSSTSGSTASSKWQELAAQLTGTLLRPRHTGGVEETADGRSIAFSRRELIQGAGVLLGAGVVGAGVSSCSSTSGSTASSKWQEDT